MNDQNDSLLAQMEAEFAQIDMDLAAQGIDEDDQRLIWGYTHSLARRQDEIERTKAYAQRTVTRLENEIQGYKNWKGHLVEEAVARGIQGKKKKSLDTPGGRVGFRLRPKASLVFFPQDKTKLIDWAKSNCPAAITVDPQTFSLVKTPLVEFIQKGGQCPLATINAPGEDFYYKPPKEQNNGRETESPTK